MNDALEKLLMPEHQLYTIALTNLIFQKPSCYYQNFANAFSADWAVFWTHNSPNAFNGGVCKAGLIEESDKVCKEYVQIALKVSLSASSWIDALQRRMVLVVLLSISLTLWFSLHIIYSR